LKCRIVKPSDTRYKHCVKVVKENYCAIVTTLTNINEETPEPEALGISKALSTISAMFLLGYMLPQVTKLVKILQTEKLDVTVISSLVGATLYYALTPAANWALALRDMEKSLEETISLKITVDDIKSFQNNVGIPFVSTLKANISGSQDVVSAFSIFDSKKTPKLDSSEYSNNGKDSLSILFHQYGLPLSLEKFQKQALITDEFYATFLRHYIAKQPKKDMSSQLCDLSTNEMLKPMFPNLRTLANVTSSWDSISGEKLFKNK